jgi:hypothetical protein
MQGPSKKEHPRHKGRPAGNAVSVVIAVALCSAFILAFAVIVLDSQETPRTGPGHFPRKNPVPFGFNFYVTPALRIPWTDLTFQLSEGANATSWSNLTSQDLTSSQKNITWHYGQPKTLSNLSIWFNVTDALGNGRWDSFDAISFTTGSANRFSANTTYTLSILYEPTGGSLLSLTFYG